jgi:predicted outer membrane repeat protein
VNIISNTASSDGGGIRCLLYCNPTLQNVTITDNSAFESGGGIICISNSVPIFSNIDRCNIYLNYAGIDGNDLFSQEPLFVFADTFTVAQPDDYFASPIENFTFDILNSIIEPVTQDLYVSPSGSDENSGLSIDNPLKTISFTLLKINGDSLNTHTIYLSEGTYSPSQTGEKFPLNCKEYISINGEHQDLTILDGDDLSNLICCSDDNNFSIENLTLMNGNGYNGGGICFLANSAPHLKNLLITDNYGYRGGGLYCFSSSPSLENVEIINNQAGYRGGGIFCTSNSCPNILNSIIDNNSASWGGGISLRYDSNAIIENVSISNNSASGAGGISCSSSDPTLQNVIISNNSASSSYAGNGGGIGCFRSDMTLLNTLIENNSSIGDGGGIYCILFNNLIMKNVIIANNISNDQGGGIYFEDEYDIDIDNITITGNSASNAGGGIYADYGFENYVTLRNSILWDNSPQEIIGSSSDIIVSYSDIQGGWNGTGNIDANPLFVGTGEFPYALLEASPCIDAGNPDSIFYDPEDPSNPGYALYPAMGTVHNDMGAYGGPNAIGWVPVPVNDEVIIQPTLCKLYQNYPNPFNPSGAGRSPITTISFSIPNDCNLELSIYNIKGQKVKEFLIISPSPGHTLSVTWDGTDDNNKPVSSGIYFYKLKAGDFQKVKKMILLR